jgi:NAD(P)H-flavin reductase
LCKIGVFVFLSRKNLKVPYKIVSKEQLSDDVFTADVEAPLIARAANRANSSLLP